MEKEEDTHRRQEKYFPVRDEHSILPGRVVLLWQQLNELRSLFCMVFCLLRSGYPDRSGKYIFLLRGRQLPDQTLQFEE